MANFYYAVRYRRIIIFSKEYPYLWYQTQNDDFNIVINRLFKHCHLTLPS